MDPWKLGSLLRSLVEAMAINAEIESMKVCNQARDYQGYAQAYIEEDFKEKADQLWGISNNILESIR